MCFGRLDRSIGREDHCYVENYCAILTDQVAVRKHTQFNSQLLASASEDKTFGYLHLLRLTADKVYP